MNSSKLLSRYYIKGQGGLPALFGMNSVKTVWGKIGVSLLAAYMALVFGFFIFSSLLNSALLSGNSFMITTLFYTVNFPFLFMSPLAIGLFQSGKDLDMLLSLPVERKDIFLSRLSVLMMYLVPVSLIVFIPMLAISALLFGFAPLWYVSYILMHLAVISAVGMLLAFICSAFPKKLIQVVTTVVSFLLMFLLFRTGMKQFDSVLDGGVPELKVPTPSPMIPLLILIAAVALSLVLYPVSIRRFGLNAKDKEKKGGKAKQRTGSRLGALIKSELVQIEGDSALKSEVIMEFILPIFLIVLYMIMGIAGDLYEMMKSLSAGVREMMPFLLVGTTCTINMLSSTTYSREGKMREILKSLPIKREERMLSKLTFHVVCEIPTITICTIVFSVLLKVGPATTVLSLVAELFVTVLCSLIGLNIDIRNPYLGWEKRVEAVKKNFNGFKATMATLALAAISVVPWMAMKMSAIPTLLISMAIMALFILLFAIMLRKVEEK